MSEIKREVRPEILCVANSYTKKYYLEPDFTVLPESIRQELQIACVTFTEDVGGVLTAMFDAEGNLLLSVMADDEDYLYDEISAGLLLKEMQKEKEELFSAIERYYQARYLGLSLT